MREGVRTVHREAGPTSGSSLDWKLRWQRRTLWEGLNTPAERYEALTAAGAADERPGDALGRS
jgi:hypothetical protein